MASLSFEVLLILKLCLRHFLCRKFKVSFFKILNLNDRKLFYTIHSNHLQDSKSFYTIISRLFYSTRDHFTQKHSSCFIRLRVILHKNTQVILHDPVVLQDSDIQKIHTKKTQKFKKYTQKHAHIHTYIIVNTHKIIKIDHDHTKT